MPVTPFRHNIMAQSVLGKDTERYSSLLGLLERFQAKQHPKQEESQSYHKQGRASEHPVQT